MIHRTRARRAGSSKRCPGESLDPGRLHHLSRRIHASRPAHTGGRRICRCRRSRRSSHRRIRAGPAEGQLENAERVRQPAHAPRTLGAALREGHRGDDRRPVRHPVLRAGRARAVARMLRRGIQGIGRGLLDHAGLPRRQVPGARVLHHRAVRAAVRRVLRLEDLRQRQQAAQRDLREARPRRRRRLRDRAGDLGLVPQGDHLARPAEGPEDALLRARREGDAEAWGRDAAPRPGRHLPGARARRDRRHRVLDAHHGHQAGLPPGGEVQLLPRLAPARLGERGPDEQEGRTTRCPSPTRR